MSDREDRETAKKKIRKQAKTMRNERLNEDGRACIDTWEELRIAMVDAPPSLKARLAKAAEGHMRAAFQADQGEAGRALERLRDYMDQKAQTSSEVRTIH